jgi:NAD(P)H-dependent FMN reductase
VVVGWEPPSAGLVGAEVDARTLIIVTGAVRLLLVSGSTRAHSTNSAALRTLQEMAPLGVQVSLYSCLAELPAFIPDEETPPPAGVLALRGDLAGAGAVVFCTPE